ncbi:MAG: acetyltransferase [Chloroflexi bacterium]|nr:MAG: acetyltransferase [Chloroflexota bacterium]
MQANQIDAYLARIGVARPAQPDIATLYQLQYQHLRVVPFENLSIHLGEQIQLDDDSFFDKLVTRGRGGFCYELNGGFGALLAGLGYEVEYVAGRVYGPSGLGPPFDHLALRVQLDEPWLVDVGFGRFADYPLRLNVREPQPDPAGEVLVVEQAEGDLDILIDGKPQYRLELRPRSLLEFEPTCWWHQTSPKSHFTQSTVCSLPTSEGRITISDRVLIETTANGRRQHTFSSDDELLAAYREHFGIVLEHAPVTLHPRGIAASV